MAHVAAATYHTEGRYVPLHTVTCDGPHYRMCPPQTYFSAHRYTPLPPLQAYFSGRLKVSGHLGVAVDFADLADEILCPN